MIYELTDKRLRRGVCTDVPEPIEAITTWGSDWNDDPSHSSGSHRPRDHEEVQRGRVALIRQANQRRSTGDPWCLNNTDVDLESSGCFPRRAWSM
jgi:hypothetical protein